MNVIGINPQIPKCDLDSKLSELSKVLDELKQYNILSDCKQSTFYNQLISDYFGFNFYLNEEYFEESSNDSVTNCPSNGYNQYLNQKEVQKVIDVSEKVGEWHECKNVNYSKKFDESLSMRQTITQLISKYKIQNLIIFNGDLDIVCNFIGGQLFVDGLGFKLTEMYKKWSVNGVTAGFVKRYEGITFMTVRGSGHMVPQDKPEAALKIAKELIGISRVDE